MSSSAGLPEDGSEEPCGELGQVVDDLHEQLSTKLGSIAWTLIHDRGLAADAVQETFVLFAEKFESIEPERRVGWLVRTVQLQSQNIRRKFRDKSLQRRVEIDHVEVDSVASADRTAGQQELNSVQSGWNPSGRTQVDVLDLACLVSPEALLQKSEEVAAIQAAIDALPPEQQIVVRKRFVGEQSFADIAAELDLPLGTVLSRLRLALKKLRKSLHGWFEDDAD